MAITKSIENMNPFRPKLFISKGERIPIANMYKVVATEINIVVDQSGIDLFVLEVDV